MKLYDGKSAVEWVYGDHPSDVDGMREDDSLFGFFDRPVVLYDDGNGKAYGWEFLENLCSKWGVALGDDAGKAFKEVRVAMQTPQPDLDQMIADLSQALSDNADAIAELSQMVSDLQSKEA